MKSIVPFLLLSGLLLNGSLALRAMSDTSRVYTFIEEWRRFLAADDVNCHYVEACYADTVLFYNVPLSKDNMCMSELMLPGLNEILLETAYTLEEISDAQWKAVFESPANIFGIDKFHYLIIEESAEHQFHIIRQSSFADDRWFARKKEIAANTIVSNGKTYYILNEDSTTLTNRRLYFLTDSLHFTEPAYMDICMDEKSIGYCTSGNIYVAMSEKNRRDIAVIRDLTPEFNCDTFQDAVNMQKGFRCFGVKDSTDPFGQSVYRWVTSECHWSSTDSGGAFIQFYSPYNYGDECREVCTTINVVKKKKQIVVLRRTSIRPPARDQY